MNPRPRITRSIVARLALALLLDLAAATWAFVAAALRPSRAPFLIASGVVLVAFAVPLAVGVRRAYRAFKDLYGEDHSQP